MNGMLEMWKGDSVEGRADGQKGQKGADWSYGCAGWMDWALGGGTIFLIWVLGCEPIVYFPSVLMNFSHRLRSFPDNLEIQECVNYQYRCSQDAVSRKSA